LVLLDGPRRAQPRSRFLTVETQTGSFRGLKPKPDLPTVSRPSNKGRSLLRKQSAPALLLWRGRHARAEARGEPYTYYD
jgi:hypothetical protein